MKYHRKTVISIEEKILEKKIVVAFDSLSKILVCLALAVGKIHVKYAVFYYFWNSSKLNIFCRSGYHGF